MTPPSTYTTADGEAMSRSTFVTHFVAAACAAWTVERYEDYCAMDRHASLGRPPFEDFLMLAADQWTYLTRDLRP